jgi:hypothetical protein
MNTSFPFLSLTVTMSSSKPFQCRNCPSSFPKADALKRHRRFCKGRTLEHQTIVANLKKVKRKMKQPVPALSVNNPGPIGEIGDIIMALEAQSPPLAAVRAHFHFSNQHI